MKTPKRKYTFPIDSLNYPGMRGAFEGECVPSAHAVQCTRWHRKNRVKSLKNTIRTINNKLADANLSRIILRNYLINKRNAYIIRSRKAETEQARKDWLAATLDLSIFINLSYTPAELIAELNGKDPIPHAIKFTEEERAILTSLREEETINNPQ
jgi:hypothetical protein